MGCRKEGGMTLESFAQRCAEMYEQDNDVCAEISRNDFMALFPSRVCIKMQCMRGRFYHRIGNVPVFIEPTCPDGMVFFLPKYAKRSWIRSFMRACYGKNC